MGDQLNLNHPWFENTDNGVLYAMMEIRQETDYVKHHAQKLLAFFASMRNFARALENRGHQVVYLKIGDAENTQSLYQNLTMLFEKHAIEKFEYQEPDEYRLDHGLKSFCGTLKLPSSCESTHHFFTKRGDLAAFFKGKKTFLMEGFYRHFRKKTNTLMENGEPVGGKWNYDAQNRKPLPKGHKPPPPLLFEHNLSALWSEIKNSGAEYFGNPSESSFPWPLSRKEAEKVLRYFCTELLPRFGDFQDAMHTQEHTLYHSRLSFALNVKMLSPHEVCEAAIAEWKKRKDEISLSQIEGFVRQILGWREYMRGIYWAKMPGYASLNFFGHTRPLPAWYWNGKTKMNCLKHAIGQSLETAYAHHIQRLMVTGNFALLAGVDPSEVDAWYLGIYIDAIEWVEITNTRGMSQFADGGMVGTKPYVSSANYIKKMSNYCEGCFYSHDKKKGERSCPFNSLYWHFYHRHRDKLKNNPRIGMMYRTWDKMAEDKQSEILQQAEKYLKGLDSL